MTDKYQAACIAYATAVDDIKRHKAEIGDRLHDCWSTQNERYTGPTPFGCGLIPENATVKHLENAYAIDRGENEFGYEVACYANHDGDVSAYLTEHCPHCLAAHVAIQARKEARKRLGIAKRRITVLGKNAGAQA